MPFHTDDNKALIEWPKCWGRDVHDFSDHPDYEFRMKVIKNCALLSMDDLNWMDHPEANQ